MTIQNNIPAMQAHRNMWSHSNRAAKSLERITTGYRINRAADDPAGLAISEKMRAQIGMLEKQMDNTRMALAEVRTLEARLETANSILQRMNELSVQAASDTLTDEDRELLDVEYQELLRQLQDLVSDGDYNPIQLETGRQMDTVPLPQGDEIDNLLETLARLSSPDDLQALQDAEPAGENATLSSLRDLIARAIDGLKPISSQLENRLGEEIKLSVLYGPAGMGRLKTLAVFDSGSSIGTREGAQAAMESTKSSVNTANRVRALCGAYSSALEQQLAKMQEDLENLTASESTIRDADIAAEMVNFAKEQILTQAAQVAMSQAMDQPRLMAALLKTLEE